MLPEQVFAAYNRTTQRAGRGYRYCPACGVALPQVASARQFVHYPACDWRHYQNPAPAVVALIAEGGSVLVGKRAKGHLAGEQWCLPGGFVEFDEDFLTAGIREVREETGLDVAIRSILSVVSNFHTPDLHTLVVVLLAEPVGGELLAGDDLAEVRWAPLQGPLPEMAFEADRHIIERYARTRAAGAPVDPRYCTAERRGP